MSSDAPALLCIFQMSTTCVTISHRWASPLSPFCNWKFVYLGQGNDKRQLTSAVFTNVPIYIQYIHQYILSRPLLRLMYGEYWFRLSRLSMMVIGSFASYTKTKLVESAVWCLLTLDDGVEQVARVLEVIAGSKYLNTVQDQNCSFSLLNNNKQNSMNMKWSK
jgi:hypothetical protein